MLKNTGTVTCATWRITCCTSWPGLAISTEARRPTCGSHSARASALGHARQPRPGRRASGSSSAGSCSSSRPAE
uniref:Secreted protein n=1 Tax=Macrostomum lignano TaxID=282301 RepID=A0A1I8HHX7_9PLAT